MWLPPYIRSAGSEMEPGPMNILTTALENCVEEDKLRATFSLGCTRGGDY